MGERQELDARSLIERALELGASVAGVASVEDLKRAPSFALAEAGTELADGRGGRPGEPVSAPGRRVMLPRVTWPDGAASVVVVAVEHPVGRPELDWWYGREDPPGNRVLARIVTRLCDWVSRNAGIQATHLPYHVERGGLYLKDAAVLSGLGVMGRNNLLVTPRYGPRVRLRALTLSAALPSTGPVDFDPCTGCPAPCQSACPRTAFSPSPDHEPARLSAAGGFSRSACFVQMDADVTASTGVTKYCRACELTCLVGLGSV